MAFSKTPSISKPWIKSSSSSQSPSSSSQFSTHYYNINRKSFFVFLFLSFFFLFFLLLCFFLSSNSNNLPSITVNSLQNAAVWPPFTLLDDQFRRYDNIKIGFIINRIQNQQYHDDDTILDLLGLSDESKRKTETVRIPLDPLDADLDWKTLFPEWIDEDEKYNSPKCPNIPMPKTELYSDLDVVVLRIPCTTTGSGADHFRDAYRLQANLAAARLAVASAWVEEDIIRPVHVAFLGSCGPMREIFRCDDLVFATNNNIDGARRDRDDPTVQGLRVYKPEMMRLKQKILMPFGSCQLAPVYARTGREVWRHFMIQKANSTTGQQQQQQKQHHHWPKTAYVTILHSSEAYVCGAIALAQSLLLTNTTRHLLLLADDSISLKSLEALSAAGWNIMEIDRIRSPFAKKGSYNEWNYSKLRVWQLVEYDKIIFIDADLLVLKNIDQLFALPHLSAVANNKMRFNSGLMVVEPSACLFEEMMVKSFELKSYNGGDQGFLNEFFTWWHRLPSSINHLKIFLNQNNELDSDPYYAIHYLGVKPWMCYKDYDCNWDMKDHHIYASDSAHSKWWQVYDSLPTELQQFCGLTKKMDARIRKWRRIATNSTLPDGHWKINITDPRRHRFMDDE